MEIDLWTLLFIGLGMFVPPIIVSYFVLSHYENKIVYTDKDLIRIEVFERINLLSWFLLTGFFIMMLFLYYRTIKLGV